MHPHHADATENAESKLQRILGMVGMQGGSSSGAGRLDKIAQPGAEDFKGPAAAIEEPTDGAGLG